MAYNGFKNAKCDEWKQTCKQTCQAKTLHARQAGGSVGEKAARSKHESTQSGSILEPQHLQVCGVRLQHCSHALRIAIILKVQFQRCTNIMPSKETFFAINGSNPPRSCPAAATTSV